MENNLIEENNASGGCWGLNVDGVGNGEIQNNAIIRGNVGNQSIGISSCINCIVENNIVIQTRLGGGAVSTSDPLFTAAPDDLRIQAASPARDSGTTMSTANIDLLGKIRDANQDRGAYEYQ